MSANKRQLQDSARIMGNQFNRRRLVQGGAIMGTAAAAGIPAGSVFAVQDDSGSDLHLLRIGTGQAAAWVRNFNPLIPDALEPTKYGVFEPLFVFSRTNGEFTPWLATEWGFNEDNTVLTFTLRDEVSWSDGEPFSADDVVFTMNLLRDNTALAGSGGIRGVFDYVESFEAPDPTTFVVNFSEVFTPGVSSIGLQSIIPKHIWQDVSDPVTFSNENPVGTGPFTEVGRFQPQYYELLRNPNYWQEDRPYIDGLACPSYGSNEGGTLGLVNDDFDWMSLFIPDVENTFVAEDPEHFRYWFPPMSACVGLYFNHTMPIFQNVDLRKAMSMGIDREQICSIAMYDYADPADATGMSNVYASWKSDEVLETGRSLVTLDVDQANQLLNDAGFTEDGNVRTSPDGEAMEFELIVPSGWSDWMQVAQLLSQQFAEIGITVSPRGVEVTTWNDRTFNGDFELSMGFSAVTPTPYDHFQNLMSTENVMPVGEASPTNWHRYGSEEITELIAEFAGTSDEAEQTEFVNQMQQVSLDEWPVAPIFLSPSWGEMNTRHFEGFPSEDDPYALPGPSDAPSFLLVITRVKPKG